jgi:hypothetical protein
MKFEESISILAEPQHVFSVYSAVAGWPAWDSEVEYASLNGEFKLGAEGKIKPKGAPESKIKITELTDMKSFTIECNLPLCKMHFIHVITPEGDGSIVKNMLEFTGLLAPLFGRLIGKSIYKTMPSSLAGLKKHIEGKS